MALRELIYTSFARQSGASQDVKDILQSSERNNVSTSVTGLLLFDGERYIQILEGASENVLSLFGTIQVDPRHGQIELLHSGGISGRTFQDWRMAYEELPTGLLDDLAENMAVYSMELEGGALDAHESFGARLNGMFMDALAAE